MAISPQQAAQAQWSATIGLPIVPASGAVLDNGKVLFWAGRNPNSFSGGGQTWSALYDPASGNTSLRNVTETQHEMFCPGTARLADGRILVNGGVDERTTSLYDPAADTWTSGAMMNTPRGYNASVPLADGSVLTVGGSWSGGVGPKPAELYTAAGGWRTLAGISTSDSTLLTSDSEGLYRADNHMWLIPMGNGRVLQAGPSPSMHWLDVRGEGSVTPAGTRADDTASMSGNAVMVDAGKILAVGGSPDYEGSSAKSDAFVIDTTTGTPVARRIGSMAYPRVFANSVVLPNGQVVVVGGQTFGQLFSDSNSVLPAEIFDPATETFTVLPAMQVPRNYHSIAMLLPDGRVVSAGGGLCGCAGDHADMQILSPPYLYNADGSAAARPVIATAPASVAYGATVAVGTSDPVAAFAMIRMGATTHTVNNDQRRLSLNFNANGTNSYLVSIPSNPGELLPGQWMLFAINAAGTPSVARIVTVSSAGAPVLQNPGDAAVTLGQSLTLPLVASTPSGTLRFTATGLPAGLAIDPATGTLSGTPQVVGMFKVTILATNGAGSTSTDLLVSVTPLGTGSGLLGQYFGNVNLTDTVLLQRTEAPNFDWGNSGPGAGVPAAAFSARWSGLIEATLAGPTQFRTVSDDGVRVWLDGRLIIDNWSIRSATSDTVSVNLVAGRRYAVTVEHFTASGPGLLRLQWQPPGAADFTAVPASRLYPGTPPATTNLAQGMPATQASVYGFGIPSHAADGNTNGIYIDDAVAGTVTHTAGGVQDWWQVDLGRSILVDRVQLWNRTDCCSDRLSNFTVFVSPSDMTGRRYDQLMADTSIAKRSVGVTPILPTLGIPFGTVGRFVRVQLAAQNYLSLAEVQVYGSTAVFHTPAVDALPPQQGTVGTALSLTVAARDPDGNLLSYTAAGLPPGLAIQPDTGLISGTATVSGSYPVVISARNAGGLSASTAFTWTVVDAPVPQVTSLPAPVSAAGSTVSYAPLLGAGATAQFSWNYGDGTSDTAYAPSPAASHAYAAAGIYTVALSVRTTDGRTAVYRFLQAVYPTGAAAPARASSSLMLEPRTNASTRVWMVNPDNDSVSVFDTATNTRLAEIAVGTGPRSVARANDGRIWVANKRSATLSIVSPTTLAVVQTLALPRASQPHGIVFSPADGTAFVTLEATGQLVKLDGTSGAVLGTLAVGDNPRHLAMNAAGSQLLLSRFITRPLPGEGTATVLTTDSTGARLGAEVLAIDPVTLALVRTTVLGHSERIDGENQGRGIPNYLGAPAISPDGRTAWVPAKQDNIKRGTLRDGNPLNFQNTVRAISSRIDLGTGAEDLSGRVDHDNAGVASAAVYHPTGAYLFVALETNRQVAVLDAAGKRELFRYEVGLAPQGVAVSSDGLKLYVHNFMGRSVSVIDLLPLVGYGQASAPAITTVPATATERLSATVLRGKQLFYDARDTRLARDSYMSCASCHSDGGHDGRVWDFTGQGEGLRNTIALRGRAGAQGNLHWSANFDEVQDFEGQIRTLAGGTGLMTDAQFATGTRSQPLGDRKAGLSADLDALAAYVGSLASFDLSPLRNADGSLTATAASGKALFQTQCLGCHGTAAFTTSGAVALQNVGTLKPSSGSRLGGPLPGIDPPTLRDAWATAPYLHDGSAATLSAAISAHNNLSLSAAQVTLLASYVSQIGGDESDPTPAAATGQGLSASYFNNSALSGTPALTRTENIDFNWGLGSPGTGVGVDQFSVRWAGRLVAPATGAYVLQTESDDGARVWVNGVQVINDWTDHGPTLDNSPSITLAAGQQVDIVVEYYENGGGATMRLRWLTPGSSTFAIVPAAQLLALPGTGLTATYFNNITLSGTPALTRSENIDFNWGLGSPGTGIGADRFSVRWTGKLVAPTAGAYVLQTESDDGTRVWVNGVQVINDWTGHSTTLDNSPSITLAAGQQAAIVVEYYENSGTATMRLRWKAPGTASFVIVPVAQLTGP